MSKKPTPWLPRKEHYVSHGGRRIPERTGFAIIVTIAAIIIILVILA